jgi:type I restriction enzyme, S subunit
MSDVPEGYKMSEVGVIPEEWEVKTLENITTEIGDGIHSTPQYVLYSDFFFVNGNNLIDNSIKITDNTMCVSEIEYNRHKKKLNQRTILLSINGTIGNIAFFNDEKVILGKSAAYINVNNSASRSFIFYLLQSSSIKNYFEDELTGSTIRNLSLKTIRNTPIAFPPTIEEQQAIASALSDADALITALEQLITKKRNIKQGVMQQLLTGERRLPGFVGEWKRMSFGKTFKFLATGNNSRSDLSEVGEVKNIHYGDIHTKWRYFLDCSKDIIPSIDEEKVKNLPLLEEGDLVMADASEDYDGLGISVEVKNIKNEKVVAGLHTLLLRGDKTVVADGYKGHIQSIKAVQDSLKRIATGISVYGISKNNLKSILISLPPLPEQQAIAQILSDMDTEIEVLKQKRDKYKAIKQGMMQELLTGKTRLV